LIAGAFGSLLVLPLAHAQDYQDMNEDAYSIQQDQRNLRHDRNEMREDLEHGNFGAAAREAQEMQERRAHQQDTERDLNRDLSHGYNGDD
jgi:hypothetical protein